MEHIQSTNNRRVKEWRKLHTKKGRDQSGLYLIEGFHLVEEALKNDFVTELIIQDNIEFLNMPSKIPVVSISVEVSRVISDTDTPQGIFAVCRKISAEIDFSRHRRFLLLDAVQDPGNIGTMIRTAEAAGVDAVIFGTGSADLYNPKVIRSAQGSHFYIRTALGDLNDWLEHFQIQQVPVFGTALEGAVPFREITPVESFALIVGNEGAGVDAKLLKKTMQNLYIPIYGQSESLNVAIAAGIILYHLRN